MRTSLLFIAAIGCSGAPPAPTPPVAPPPPPPPDAAIDAPPTPPPIARGGACDPERICDNGLLCLPAPGGYCASSCEIACDGACVATARDGELCLKSCARDADCRAAEGYLCDPQWKACIIPNSATIVPKQCPAATPARDLAFASSTQLSTSASPGAAQLDPSAVVTPAGGVTVLFGSRAPLERTHAIGQSLLGSGLKILDAAFGPATGAAGANGGEPALARDASGTLFAAWLAGATEAAAPQIRLSRSTNAGVTWSVPSVVSSAGDCSGGADCLARPIVLFGPDPAAKGKQILYVLYSASGGIRVRASRDGGATLSTAVTALEGIAASAAAGTDGRLHLVALAAGPTTGGFGSAKHHLDYAVSATGGRSFTRPKRLSGRDELLPFYFATPSIATDSARKWIYVAYVRGGRDAVWDVVVLGSKNNGTTWKRTRIGDTPGCAIHMIPSLALDPTTGTLHVAWYDSRGTGRFAHATCASGLTSCTQLGAINDVPFAGLTTGRQTRSWLGERAVLVVDDKRRALHAVWTQPIDEGGVVGSRIFHASAKLPRR